jgi:hypothetical protein
MAFNQIATSVTIINSGLIGYQGISLTDFSATTVSYIAAGSGIEIAGAFFKAGTDIVPEASSWTAITTATTAYLALTPSGTAGSQILTAAWVSSGSIIWSDSKQGWYNSGETARLVVTAYKGSATQYLQKRILKNEQGSSSIYNYENLPIGTILMFDGSGWTDNVTLLGWYSCISTNSGYGCPNLVDKFIMGKVVAGAGGTGGSNTHTNSEAEMAPHTHTSNIPKTGGGGASIVGLVTINEGLTLAQASESTGSGSAWDIRPAYYTVIYIRKCF